jgi:hypothetical protein
LGFAEIQLALDTECLARKFSVAIVIRRRFLVSVAGLETHEALAVVPGEVFIEPGGWIPRCPVLSRLQDGHSGFDDKAPRFRLLAPRPSMPRQIWARKRANNLLSITGKTCYISIEQEQSWPI